MESITDNGLTLYFDPEERQAAELIQRACQRSIQTIHTSWGLEMPVDCRVYVLTTWPRCVFQGAPLQTQILLGLTMPLWYSEFKKRWQYAGGWAQKYGSRQVVGIKAPRLIANTPQSIGESIFIKEEDLENKVLSIVSHELTHAFSSHLQLPTWLHEGLAMVTSDRSLEKQTVRADTLTLLKDSSHKLKSTEKINLKAQSREEIVLIYVRGYWLTRYLAQSSPKFLKSLLKEHLNQENLELRIAEQYGLKPENFWFEMEELVVSQFNGELSEVNQES
jgi:hypothetical protein